MTQETVSRSGYSVTLTGASEPGWRESFFEHRAAHEVLALTLMLSGVAATAHSLAASDRRDLQRLLADDVGWAVWCQGRLDHPPDGLTGADIEMARSAWRWLARSRLLGGSLLGGGSLPGVCARGVAPCPGMGVQLGVAKAQHAADLTERPCR